MRFRRSSALVTATLLISALANRADFSDGGGFQVCAGIYAKHDYGGAFKPHVGILLLRFNNHVYALNLLLNNASGIDVSYIIFEYRDIDKIGFPVGGGHYKYICDDVAIHDLHACNETQRGQFIVNLHRTNNTILTSSLKSLGQAHLNYTVNNTGYYCVSTYVEKGVQYKGTANFQNAFGELSASEIPKLPAYGILALCYAIALALFGFQFFKKRKQNQILPLQRYLLAMLVFLTFDTLVVWSYYDLVNRSKNPAAGFVIFYGVFLAILNSVKITLSFFLLLCMALGYGVVVLKLPKKVMLRCKVLAGLLFASSLVYLISAYLSKSTLATVTTSSLNDTSAKSIWGILFALPITLCLTAFYFAIMIGIRQTTLKLHQQRQVIKLQLYENLFRIIFLSFLCTFGGLTLSSFILLSLSNTEMIESHWKGAFFLYEFWPSVVYFMVFMGVAWLWRPTETSYMLAISQQLQGDGTDGEAGGHEFELDDILLMSHSDTELEAGRNDHHDEDFESIESHPVKRLPNLSQHDSGENQSRNMAHDTLFEVGDDEDDDSVEAKNEGGKGTKASKVE